MPSKPGWIDSINFVTYMMTNPCHTPLIVYAETAAPALGIMALEFVDFGMEDVMSSFFRPKGLRSGRHGRKSRRDGKKRGIPEINDIIAENSPGYEKVRARTVTQGVKNLWIIYDEIQRLSFYFLVADILKDGLYHWASTIAYVSQKFCETDHSYLGHTDEAGVTALSGWVGIERNVIVFEHDVLSDRFGFSIGEGEWFVCFSGTTGELWLADEAIVEIALLDSGSTGLPKSIFSGQEKASKQGGTQMIASGIVHGPAYFVHACKSSNNVWLKDIDIFAMKVPEYIRDPA